MKIFIIFVLCASAVYAEQPFKRDTAKEEEDRYKLECIIEGGLDPALLKRGKNAKLPTVEQESCYMACLDKKFGNMKPDGSYDEEFVLSKAATPEDMKTLKTLLKGCNAKVKNDACKMAGCVRGITKKTSDKLKN